MVDFRIDDGWLETTLGRCRLKFDSGTKACDRDRAVAATTAAVENFMIVVVVGRNLEYV